MKKFSELKTNPSYIRNFIFGSEDSLVSTVGVVFGIATANPSKKMVILAGLIVIAVEASSMGAGAYLSEQSENEQSENEIKQNPFMDGVIMGTSYFFAGFIPLVPYMIMEVSTAKYVSIGFSLIALFLLGYAPKKNLKSAIRMALVAGFAILLGFLIATGSNMYLEE
jgi:VIT1/CCC1 family predicted Fe2+/Mn2+ transporter